MSLRHPSGRGVYQDPSLGFVGVGAVPSRPSQQQTECWQQAENPSPRSCSSYNLDENGGAYDNRGPAGNRPLGLKPRPAAGRHGSCTGQPGTASLPVRYQSHQEQQQQAFHAAATSPALPLPAPSPPSLHAGAKTNILREVDAFVMSLPLGTTPGDAEIEDAVASRLYRAELARAEAHAKLGEWSKVAMELKEVVQQQQAQLQQARGTTAGGYYAAAQQHQHRQHQRHALATASAKPHIAQLQRLVWDMRDELRQPPDPHVLSAGDPQSPAAQPPRHATSWSDGSAAPAAAEQHHAEAEHAATELAAVRQQLCQLQAAHDGLLAQQAWQADGTAAAAALQMQLEHARREMEATKGEKERLRRALIDAEIELQSKANASEVLEQQLVAVQADKGAAVTAAAMQQDAALAAAAAKLAAAQADAASLQQQLAAAKAVAGEQVAAAAERDARLQQTQQAADQLAVAAAAAEATAAAQQQQREAADALVAQLRTQVAHLQVSATSSGCAAAAEIALLQEQLSAAVQREQAVQRDLQLAQQQLSALKQAHGKALNAARASQQQLAAAQEELSEARLAAEQVQRSAAAAVTLTPEMLAERDQAISALKVVLDRVTAAAREKDALITAAQQEAAAGAAARDAALADKLATEAATAGWREAAAGAEQQTALAAAAQQRCAAAEQQLLALRVRGAADAQRWEEQLLTLQRELQEARRSESGTAAAQQALQAEVAELRHVLSAKDQQIGALSNAVTSASRPSSADRDAQMQVQRMQTQIHDLLAKLAVLKEALSARDEAAMAAAVAAAASEQQRVMAEGCLETAEEQYQLALQAAEQRATEAVAAAEEWRQQAALLRQHLSVPLASQAVQADLPAAAPEPQTEPVVLCIMVIDADPAAGKAPAELEQRLAVLAEQRQEQCHELQGRLAAAEVELEAATGEHARQLSELQLQHQEQLGEACLDAAATTALLEQQHEQQLQELRQQHAAELERQQEQLWRLGELQQQCHELQGRLVAAEVEHEAATGEHVRQLSELQLQHQEQLDEARLDPAATTALLEQQHKQQMQELQQQELHDDEMQQLLQQEAQAEAAVATAASTVVLAGRGTSAGTPSPLQRRFEQKLCQVQEQHEEEMQLLLAQQEEVAEASRRAAADAQQQQLYQLRQQMEALAVEHEQQQLGLRRQYEAEAETRELQHLAELEAAREGHWELLDESLLADRLQPLEAQRMRQEAELEVLRAKLEEQCAQHERQLAAVMAKQALLLEEQQHLQQQERQLEAVLPATTLAADTGTAAAAAGQQDDQQGATAQPAEKGHTADRGQILTTSIFASVQARQLPAGNVPAGGSPGPDMLAMLGPADNQQRIADISGGSTAASANPRISSASSSPGRRVRRQLLGVAAGSPAGSALGSNLIHAAAAAGATAEMERLERDLEEAVDECERRGEALRECQEMVEELQAFAESQKRQLTGVCAELEESQRSGRDAQLRLRGLEEQLLAAQDDSSKLNSQVSKLERKCGAYREELGSLQSMHDGLQSEHTAVCGQLTAAQQQHEATLDRLQRLTERLALTQQGKVLAEQQLAALQQHMALLRDEHSHEAEVLLHELLLQRLRVSSAGASNSAGSGGTAVSSAEASLAPHLNQQQQHAPGGSTLAQCLQQRMQQDHEPQQLEQQRRQQPRPSSAPVPAALPQEPGRRSLPAVAARLPAHLQHLHQQESGGSVAELAPTHQKMKKKGVLHKVGKMLRGSKPPQPLALAVAASPPGGGCLQKADPATLTAHLEHSMRKAEAAALQIKLLREQGHAQQLQQQAERQEQQRTHQQQHQQPRVPPPQLQQAEPEPAAVPAAIRLHVQQQKKTQQQQEMVQQQQHAQQQQRDRERRRLLFTAAEEVEAEAEQQLLWMEYPGWGQQQQQQNDVVAAAGARPSGDGCDPLQQQQNDVVAAAGARSSGDGCDPLQMVRTNLPVQLLQQQVRRGSAALFDCPPEGSFYCYPDAAAAGYAAGLAAAAAEGTPPGLAAGAVLDDAAAEGKASRWQQRRLHVVHRNALFSYGDSYA